MVCVPCLLRLPGELRLRIKLKIISLELSSRQFESFPLQGKRTGSETPNGLAKLSLSLDNPRVFWKPYGPRLHELIQFFVSIYILPACPFCIFVLLLLEVLEKGKESNKICKIRPS